MAAEVADTVAAAVAALVAPKVASPLEDLNFLQFAEIIGKDVPRLFPGDRLVDSVRPRIQEVLLLYAREDPELGYTQGMGFVAAAVCVQDAGPRAEGFFGAVMLGLRRLWMPGFPMVLEGTLILQELLVARDPELLQHLCDIGIDLAMVVPGVWLSAFAKWLPLAALVDVLPLLGREGLVGLLAVTVLLLLFNRDAIMGLHDFEAALGHLNSMSEAPRPDCLLEMCSAALPGLQATIRNRDSSGDVSTLEALWADSAGSSRVAAADGAGAPVRLSEFWRRASSQAGEYFGGEHTQARALDLVRRASAASADAAGSLSAVVRDAARAANRALAGPSWGACRVSEGLYALACPCSERIQTLAARLNSAFSQRMLILDMSGDPYDTTVFDGDVVDVAFQCLPVPPLELLMELCLLASGWLSSEQTNVLLVYGQLGNFSSRPVAFLACFMTFRGLHCHLADALQDACEKVGCSLAAFVPSQRRYLAYFEHCLFQEGFSPTRRFQKLTRLEITGPAPCFELGIVVFRPFIEIWRLGKVIYSSLPQASCRRLPSTYLSDCVAGGVAFADRVFLPRGYIVSDTRVLFEFPEDLVVCDDVFVQAFHAHTDGSYTEVFQLVVHVALIPPAGFRLSKHELDGACDDPRIPDECCVELAFQPAAAPACDSGAVSASGAASAGGDECSSGAASANCPSGASGGEAASAASAAYVEPPLAVFAKAREISRVLRSEAASGSGEAADQRYTSVEDDATRAALRASRWDAEQAVEQVRPLLCPVAPPDAPERVGGRRVLRAAMAPHASRMVADLVIGSCPSVGAAGSARVRTAFPSAMMPPVMPLPPPPAAAAAQWAQHAYTASVQAAAAKAAAAKAAEVASAQAAAAQAAATQAQIAQVSAQQAAAAQVAQSLGYNVAPVGVPTAAAYGDMPGGGPPYGAAPGIFNSTVGPGIILASAFISVSAPGLRQEARPRTAAARSGLSAVRGAEFLMLATL